MNQSRWKEVFQTVDRFSVSDAVVAATNHSGDIEQGSESLIF